MTDIEKLRELLGKVNSTKTGERVAALFEISDAIGPLLDRVEKMEANARRYEWLRDKQAYVAVDPHYRELPFNERTGWTIRLVTGDDTSFDAAIDAALRGKGE